MRRQGEKFPDNGFEAWGGYMQAKISKLEDQFTSRAGREDQMSDIFSGVSIYVNGYTVPSADELKALMSKHGGIYHTYQRNEDVIIASNLPDTKVKKMSLVKVVQPEWITDSIAANRLLDYKDYLLYRSSRAQPKLNFNKVFKNDNTLNEKKPSLDMIKQSDENFEKKCVTSIIDISEYHKPNSSNGNAKLTVTPPKIDENLNLECDFKKPEHVTKTAADPNFISEFYNNSRLHHISQLGACFKQHVNDLRENCQFSFPLRTDLKKRIDSLNHSNLSPLYFEKGKTIMHIDMDCFFVSVGLRNKPELQGKPIAVTHSKGGQARPKRPGVDRNVEFNLYKQKQAGKLAKAVGKLGEEIELETRVDNITDEDDKYGSMSEIASCSYEARAKGVGNGMFMGAALRLCPDLQTIPYDFEGYKEVAYTLYNTIAQYTLDIEAVSCDEMYVDCTELLKEMNVSAQDFGTVLRNEIKNKTGCPCSTGFGGNRLQARLATKRAKPDGQFFLTADLVEDFMFDIKLADLPGVGRQTAQKLESLGHHTCGSLQSLSLAVLKNHLGNKTGAQLFDQCRGRDGNPLTYLTVRKSVSAEVNYGIRFDNNDQCMEFLRQLSAEVHSRMQQCKVLGQCITLKLMVRAENAPVETAKFMGHGFCNVINKSSSLTNATDDVEIITKEVISLCKKQNIDPKEMRGIGIQITKLEQTHCKQIKGAMNKFLSVTRSVKTENCSQIAKNVIFPTNQITFRANTKTKGSATPKKVKISTSPGKKSPVLGPVKSPTGKRRGRPPKNLGNQGSTSKNLMSKFLQGQIAKDTPYKNPMFKDFYEISPVSPLEPIVKDTKPQGLIGLPWEKVRELLRAWLESGQTPLPCDIEMIEAYMCEMVINKNIEKLYVLLNFLRRRTSELNCKKWKAVYEHNLNQVQNAMIAVYGKKLWIDE